MKKIPYGQSDIIDILQNNYYYVDKTRFIPLVEEAGKYLFFIRPRRFGKSLWLATLETYYDIKNKDRLTEIFKNTWIAKNLTPEAGNYYVLRFNFSLVDPHPEKVHESFNFTCLQQISDFAEYYRDYLPSKLPDKLLQCNQIDQALKILTSRNFYHQTGHKLYILIDEYDNFTNTILSSYSHQAYHNITHGEGFLRYFFNILKGATTGPDAPLGKLFITGVSPITMDDVTSGFNIADPITLEPDFNELAGFTASEVRDIFNYYIQTGWLNQSLEQLLEIASSWYNNYKFYNYSTTSLYNPDMVFYFVKQTGRRKRIPATLIDDNVRTDYNKLKHLIVIDRQLNGNFSILQDVINQGSVNASIVNSFPLENLTDDENFISHLFYLGLLSFLDEETLIIPNQTVWTLLFGYIREAYKDLNIFKPSIWQLQQSLRIMAYEGKWQDTLQFLADEVKKQTSIRDYLTGESVIKILLAAYLNITDYFLIHTEKEANKGFADIYLEPFWEKNKKIKYGYLIELKYISRSEKITEALLEEKRKQAREQLEKYAQDEKIKQKFAAAPGGQLIKIYHIWHGWELLEIQDV